MSLKQEAVKGVKWSGAATSVNLVLQFAQLFVLAYLLDPADFGLFAMARIIMGLALAVSDVGISNAIIQSQSVTKQQLSTLYWLSIGVGFLLFILLWIGAPVIAGFYQEEALLPLIFWIGLNFIFSPFGQQFQKLMEKELIFRELSLIQIGAGIAGTVATIWLAYAGNGVLSLVWGQLLRTILLAGCYATFGWRRWRPEFYFNLSEIDAYIRFGLFQMGERLVNYFGANADYIVIGRVWDAEILGLYSFAYELVLRPVQLLNPVIVRVAFPIFSKKQTDNVALRYGYAQVLRLLATIMAPLFTGIALTADIFIPAFFDPKWVPSIIFIQVLCTVGFLKALANPSGSILLAKGRADLGFYWNLGVATINLLLFIAVVTQGALAVAISYSLVSILFSLATWKLIQHLIELDFKAYFSAITPPILGSVVMGIVVLALRQISVVSNSQILLFAILATAGSLSYLALTVATQQNYVKALIQLVR